MIGGIGTDLVLMPRIAEVLERHGERFARRVLTERELATWRARTDRVAFLAKRFAAKEAAAKALGTGIGATVSFHDLEIGHDALGRPLLETSPRLSTWMRRQGWSRCLISLSDEGDHALAFAVVEG
ncbi:MAG: holo-ACP synthase [Ectothiorhodospiraceae bacterium]|nr:holo-ACP synthase [Ectothiorhodospiraceae bacterium]